MSHFCLLVVTDTDSPEELEKALQPFHEFECTGDDDQYVQEIDDTEKHRASYDSETQSMIRMPDAQLITASDEQFYRDPTDEEKKLMGPLDRPKIRFVPEGATEVEVPVKELKSFRDFLQDWTDRPTFTADQVIDRSRDAGKYGYTLVDAEGNVLKTFDRTNPDPKWDWWQIGGRYTGQMTPGYDPEKDPLNQEQCTLCHGTGKRADMEVANGCNGCRGKGISTKWPTSWAEHAGDRVRVSDIPWQALEEQSVKEATDEWDKAAALTQGLELPGTWASFRDEHGVEKAREIYNALPAVTALREWFDTGRIIEKLKKPRDEILADARNEPIGCFAILHEGKWYERGEAGWWGIVTNEMDEDVWATRVTELLRSLPPEKFVTVVDCHI